MGFARFTRAEARRKKITATFNARVRARVVERLKPPVTADFKPSDLRCRIHPAIAPPISCLFDSRLADQIYNTLRQAARVEGNAIINSQTAQTETIRISEGDIA